MKQSIIWVCTVLPLGITCEAHEPTDTNWWSQYNGYQMAVGDFNGDTIPDTVIAEEHREPGENPGDPSSIMDKHFRMVDGATQLPQTFILEPESEVLGMDLAEPSVDSPYPVLQTSQYAGSIIKAIRYVLDPNGELVKEKDLYPIQPFFPPGAPVPSYTFAIGPIANPGLVRVVVETDNDPDYWTIYLRPYQGCDSNFPPFYRYKHCGETVDMWLNFPDTGWYWIRVYDFEDNLIHEGQKNFV